MSPQRGRLVLSLCLVGLACAGTGASYDGLPAAAPDGGDARLGTERANDDDASSSDGLPNSSDGGDDASPEGKTDAQPTYVGSCSACGRGTVCVQMFGTGGPSCVQQTLLCVPAVTGCQPAACTQACREAICPLGIYGLPDGGIIRYHGECRADRTCARELPDAFHCYYDAL
jgi:hypothetical protein